MHEVFTDLLLLLLLFCCRFCRCCFFYLAFGLGVATLFSISFLAVFNPTKGEVSRRYVLPMSLDLLSLMKKRKKKKKKKLAVNKSNTFFIIQYKSLRTIRLFSFVHLLCWISSFHHRILLSREILFFVFFPTLRHRRNKFADREVSTLALAVSILVS